MKIGNSPTKSSEKIKNLSDWPGYSVDVFGQIYGPRKMLTPFDDGTGYYYVNLSCKGRRKKIAVHRLVASAFIPNPENKPTVNHLNGEKNDNGIGNLEWATHSENHQHAFKVLGRKVKGHLKPKGDASPHARPVLGDGVFYGSLPSASEATGIDKRQIHRACQREGKAHGITWRFYEDI